MIDTALRAILLADTDVAAVVDERVWFGLRPQGERRAGIVIRRTGGSDPGTLEGSAGYVTGSMDLDVLAPTYKDAKQLAVRVTTAIDGYSGAIAGTLIDWLAVSDDSDIPQIPPEAKSTPTTYGVSLTVDFQIQS